MLRIGKLRKNRKVRSKWRVIESYLIDSFNKNS